MRKRILLAAASLTLIGVVVAASVGATVIVRDANETHARAADPAPTVEAWTVTGKDSTFTSSGSVVVQVAFTLPGGGEGHWRAEAGSYQFILTKEYKCWETVRIGERIPDCLR